MNYVLLVREGDCTQQLFAEFKSAPKRQPSSQSLLQGLFAEGQGDHQMTVDEVGALKSQNVRMIELCRQPHLAREVVERLFCHEALVRNLEGNVDALERIECAEDRRVRPIRQPRLQLVLTNLLARL